MLRVGIGYDIHSAVKGNAIVLGGILLPAPFSLKGQSDADVLLHSLTDAILGALGEKDIGYHFPDDQEINHARESKVFLKYAYDLMRSKNYSIINIDLNVICEKPKLNHFRNQIEENIARLLKIESDQVNLKAKTNEGLDDLGKEKGISAQAIVLLKQK